MWEFLKNPIPYKTAAFRFFFLCQIHRKHRHDDKRYNCTDLPHGSKRITILLCCADFVLTLGLKHSLPFSNICTQQLILMLFIVYTSVIVAIYVHP